VLVPTEDYSLAMIEEKRVDLSRIQVDLERRRQRQETREREARAIREAKELEGCTFAPTLMTKKRRANMPPTSSDAPVGTIQLELGDNRHEGHVDDVEGRDLDRFLQD